jgi:hypothetical protein
VQLTPASAEAPAKCEIKQLNTHKHRYGRDDVWHLVHRDVITFKDKETLDPYLKKLRAGKTASVICNNYLYRVNKNANGVAEWQTGINMTRALGDYQHPDLYKVPTVLHNTITIQPSTEGLSFLLLASDGLDPLMQNRLPRKVEDIFLGKYAEYLANTSFTVADLAQQIASFLTSIVAWEQLKPIEWQPGKPAYVHPCDDISVVLLPLLAGLPPVLSAKVADGHGGSDTAEYAIKQHGTILRQKLATACATQRATLSSSSSSSSSTLLNSVETSSPLLSSSREESPTAPVSNFVKFMTLYSMEPISPLLTKEYDASSTESVATDADDKVSTNNLFGV